MAVRSITEKDQPESPDTSERIPAFRQEAEVQGDEHQHPEMPLSFHIQSRIAHQSPLARNASGESETRHLLDSQRSVG